MGMYIGRWGYIKMRFQEENQRINKEYNNKNMKKNHTILIVHTN